MAQDVPRINRDYALPGLSAFAWPTVTNVQLTLGMVVLKLWPVLVGAELVQLILLCLLVGHHSYRYVGLCCYDPLISLGISISSLERLWCLALLYQLMIQPAVLPPPAPPRPKSLTKTLLSPLKCARWRMAPAEALTGPC